MKQHAYLKFLLNNKEYTYTGDEEKLMAIPQIADVVEQYYEEIAPHYARMTHQSVIMGLIQRAGGTITEVHSIRPDGSWRAEDLPDYKVY